MQNRNKRQIAYYHLPGLFEFYELYKVFLPLFREHREYFYDWCEIGSIYGAPADCLWGGGRCGFGDQDPREVLELMREYGISARLTFSNSLLRKEHLGDKRCNQLCELLSRSSRRGDAGRMASASRMTGVSQMADVGSVAEDDCMASASRMAENGVIVSSDLLLAYLRQNYPDLYMVSSTTKVLTDFDDLKAELDRPDFRYVVPDFRLNKQLAKLSVLTSQQKDKVEFLCNECCYFGCRERAACYEAVSRMNLGEEESVHICHSPESQEGYRFSRAMKNPGFIGIRDITETYLPMGFTNFKIEGRSLGSALVLEFLLYYMTKPEHQIKVREEIYLDNSLDLF